MFPQLIKEVAFQICRSEMDITRNNVTSGGKFSFDCTVVHDESEYFIWFIISKT